MKMKRTAMAALAALLACAAVAPVALGTQINSQVSIRFVEVIEIPKLPPPLSGESIGDADPTELAEDGADTAAALRRARSGKFLRQRE